MSKRFEIDITGDIIDLKETNKPCIALNDSEICELLNKQDKKITDLEAKLAEKEELLEESEECKEFNAEMWTRFADKCKDLTKQLAEKEKQIETQKSNIEFLYDLFVSPKEEQILKAINQDKISFAVEQLEKVKDFVKENESWEIEGSDYSIVYADDVLVRIDNQIEELKKEMK